MGQLAYLSLKQNTKFICKRKDPETYMSACSYWAEELQLESWGFQPELCGLLWDQGCPFSFQQSTMFIFD